LTFNFKLLTLKSISVFCGSSKGDLPEFEQAAHNLGLFLAKNNIRLVYGGGKVGLMGVVANAVLHAGGKVTGVIPEFMMPKEVAHEGLTELILVDSMHSRKLKMFELSDGIIALPGGFGTLDELFEILTWAQLGLHQKPTGLLNVANYYDHLLTFIDNIEDRQFLKSDNKHLLLSSPSLEDLWLQMLHYKAPDLGRWMNTIQKT